MSVRTTKDDNGTYRAAYEGRAIPCAGPSLDALTAITTSIDTELRKGGVDEAAARFAGSLNETVQTIGNRTRVIQLLSVVLYRACEAYANGAFDDFGYSIILGHIDLFMLQLLSADILRRAHGREDIAEKTAIRDEVNIEVQRLRGELSRRIQDLAQLLAQAQFARDHAARDEALEARKAQLEAGKAALTSERNKLEGPATEQGSLAHTRSQLAEIDEARRTAAKKKAEFDQKPNDQAARTAYEDAARKVRIAEVNRQYLAARLTRGEEHLQDINLRLATADGELAKVTADIAYARRPPVTAAPAKDRVAAAERDIDRLQKDLATAQSEVATAVAALARASEGTGSGPAEMSALAILVEHSFEAAKGKGPPGRVSKLACLQWFARNPQLEMVPGTVDGPPTFKDGQSIPGIAVYCQRILSPPTETNATKGERTNRPSHGS